MILNAALVSYASTGQGAFVTSAGYIGPKYKVAHDVSLLIPEIWSRLSDYENDPKDMIEKGYLEKVPELSMKEKTYRLNILDIVSPEDLPISFLAEFLQTQFQSFRRICLNQNYKMRINTQTA